MHDNSYFSDITELFLTAKKAENIEVNPHSKAAIREMLSYKIEQLKKGAETQETFWSKWKKTLIGVPASILAVFVIVFALQNSQINMPRETEGGDIINEADLIETVEDSAVIKDIEKPEKRTVKVDPLVIDYGDAAKPVQSTTPKTSTQQETVTEEPVLLSVPTTTPVPLPTPQPTNTPISEPVNEPTVTQPVTMPAPSQEIPTEKVKEIIDNGIMIQSDENITQFREPISPIAPDFDKTALEKLNITDNLSTVNVHYLNEDQAAIEVTNQDGTRWYMVEELNGNWTVTQKFD
jgi:outer membrane biosynthesis protein TonB